MNLAEEAVPAGEAATIQSLVDRLQAKITRDNAGGLMRRDAHPKMHGLVAATFTVEPGLPPELRVGLFAQPQAYPAWVRFSNQGGSISPDSGRDIRGMAIKLMGVPGAKLLADECDALTHDFILVSTPMFVTRDAAEFDDLLAAVTGSLWAKTWFFITHLRVSFNLLRSMLRFANPLQIRYFSTTPYLLGRAAVKYSATPRVTEPDSVPEQPDPDYLRLAMVRQLGSGDACFDFAVQFQLDAEAMPIEDPGHEWPERLSPFRKVATLHIAAQDFDTPQRRELGESLSFTPWHALPGHRPLGGINRARRVVYEAISKYRHACNQQPRREPTGWDL